MELTKAVAENLGKVFLNIGQGMVLSSLVSGFLGEEIAVSTVIVVFLLRAFTVTTGLWFTAASSQMQGVAMNTYLLISILIALAAMLTMLWAKRQIKNQQSQASKRP